MHVLRCSILLWPSILLATPIGSIMLDCGFIPLMSSLSDRNMRLGDAREVSVSFLVGYPKWKVRCSTAAVSLSIVAKVEIDQRGS